MKSYNNWSKVSHFDVTVKIFVKSFKNVNMLTINTKLRDFQYRLLHKRVPTNRELARWNIKNSSRCELCNEEDNIEHTLYECGKTSLK